MDIETLKQKYGWGDRNFPWIVLKAADLSGLTLVDAQLNRANLEQASLENADLSQTNLMKAILVSANLRQIKLMKAQLYKADLTAANLESADLTEAYLAQAIFADANLTSSNLTLADLTKADLTGANLEQANLTGAKLHQTNLIGANLLGANLTDIEIDRADFTEAVMPDGRSFAEWIVDHPATMPTESLDEDVAKEPPSPVKDSTLKPVFVPDRILYEFLPRNRRRRYPSDIWSQLSWQQGDRFLLILLLVFFCGYFGIGMELAVHQAYWFPWLLAWAGSIAWVFHEAFTWFAPVAGGLAVMGSMMLSLLVYILMGVTILVSIINLKGLGFKLPVAIRDGLWLGGVVGFLVALLLRQLSITLVLSVLAISLGSLSWLMMEEINFTQKEISRIMGVVSGLGLSLGGLVQWLI